MTKSLMIAAAVAALCVPAPALAQMQPQRIENVNWHMVELVKLQPGKRERAMEIIQNYFAPAMRDIGGSAQMMDLHFNTGEWDEIIAFPMSGGPNDLTWETSPEDVRWMNALAARAGGMDKARALLSGHLGRPQPAAHSA